jgi:hypothetical protein
VLCDDVAGADVVTPCIIEEAVVFSFPNMKASRRHVIIKITAAAVVIFVKNEPAPPPPNTVWLEPPKAAPISAPLPFCRRTIRMRAKHTTICKKITINCI